MKTFIFDSKKGNNGNTFSFINNYSKKSNKSYVDSLLDDAYKFFLPWEKKKVDNKIYLSLSKIDFTPEYTLLNVSSSALSLEYNKAISRLIEYLYYLENPTYDFLICDTPVKIHGNYIQVGTHIIPKFTKANYFNNFDKETKINLYNIALTINLIAA